MAASGRVDFILGNSYSRIAATNAKFDRSGCHRRIHDWTLYVDVVTGEEAADLIERVCFDMKDDSFDPREFTCYCPIRKRVGNVTRYRFHTRQKTFGAVNAEITIRGRGGSTLRFRHRVVLQDGGVEAENVQNFVERRPQKPLKPIKMDGRFGIELEMTSDASDTAADISKAIRARAAIDVVDLTHNYAAARSSNEDWKLMSDASIVCNRERPDCNKFELVSPILAGGEGLNTAYKVLDGLKKVSSINLNKSMGFHVHINVEHFSLAQLIKLCQQFIKFERAIDSIMPESRRSTVNQFCKSNRAAILGTSNRSRNERLAHCYTVDELCSVMNPGNDRYFKLNLQNLQTGRQPTVEFRQHSATSNVDKVKNWVRFCSAMVRNSAKFRSPSALKESTEDHEAFEMLFEFVIKDRALRNFYRERRAELRGESGNNERMGGGGHCCSGCGSGGHCSASISAMKRRRIS